MDERPDLLIAGSGPLAAALFRRASELGLRTVWLDESPARAQPPEERALGADWPELDADPALCALRTEALSGLFRRHLPLLERRAVLLPLRGGARLPRDPFAALRGCAPCALLDSVGAHARVPALRAEGLRGALCWEAWGAEPGTLALRWTQEGTALGGARLPGARLRACERDARGIAAVEWTCADGREGSARPAFLANVGLGASERAALARCRTFGLDFRETHWLELLESPCEIPLLLRASPRPLFLLPCQARAWLGPVSGPPFSSREDAQARTLLAGALACAAPAEGSSLPDSRPRVRGVYLRTHDLDGARNMLTAAAPDLPFEWAAAEACAAEVLLRLGRRPPRERPLLPAWARLLSRLPRGLSRAAGELLFRRRTI